MNFNPRSHERSDITQSQSLTGYSISIHAPTRGATFSASSLLIPSFYFNPRSHERSDRCSSTCYSATDYIISIHAPTRGATFTNRKEAIDADISIHAPTRGATLSASVLSYSLIFQSTLPREERRYTLRIVTMILHFNPRSHERSDGVICSSSW